MMQKQIYLQEPKQKAAVHFEQWLDGFMEVYTEPPLNLWDASLTILIQTCFKVTETISKTIYAWMNVA